MQPLDDTQEADQVIPVDGLEVEEVHDEDTIRQFVAAWRRRVRREYATALLQDRPTHRPLTSPH